MKAKVIYVCTFLIIVITLIISCNETNLNDSGTQQISYLSHKSNGCVSGNKLMKINNEAIFNYEYSNGKLKIEALFTTQCAADFKDSVMISGNSVNIFLADTARSVAKCICPFKEEFDFEIEDQKEINVLFCLNNYVLADTLLKIY